MNKRVIVFILSFMFLLSGCTANYEEKESVVKTEATTYEAEAVDKEALPVSGGELNLTMRSPKTLNPLVNEDVTVDSILRLIFEPLFILDETQKPVPNLADSYAFSDDGLTLTLNIKNGIRWHDGSTLSGEDVVFSLDVIKGASAKSVYKKCFANISGYSASGNNVTIKYAKPSSLSLYNLCFPVIPKHYYKDKLALNSNVSLKPLGNGLYSFDNYRLVKMLTLKKEGNFKGMPYIDKINITITDNRETDMYSFEQSLSDVVNTDIMEWGKYNGNENISVCEYYENKFEFLGYNLKNPVFSNINIRKAAAYALPSDEIVETVYLGHGIKSQTPINPNSYLSSKDELSFYEYDLKKAAELVKNSGFTKEQLTFSILVNSENRERVESANIIANRLNLIGMNVTVNKQPFEKYKSLLDADSFEVFLGGTVISENSDISQLFLSSSQILPGINYFNYSSAKMDEILGKISNTTNEEGLKGCIKEAEQLILSELPCVGICFKSSALLTSKRVKGEKKPVINNIYNNIEKWFIDDRQ